MKLKGVIQIQNYETKEIIVEEENTIVLVGREQILPFLTKRVNNDTSVIVNPNTWILGYIALGSGGLQNQNDPTSKILPSPQDTDLYYPVSGFDTSLPTVTNDGKYKFASTVDFLQDTSNLNKYLITRFSVILERNEFNGYMLSEAGLFFGNSPNAKSATSFLMFSHVTFPGKLKLQQPIAFSWFIYS